MRTLARLLLLLALLWPAAAGAVVQSTIMGNSNLTIDANTTSVVINQAFSAGRTLTIPYASVSTIGQSGAVTYYQNSIVIYDFAGAISGSNTLTIQAQTGDTINGSSTFVVSTTNAIVTLTPVTGSGWLGSVRPASTGILPTTTCTNQFVRSIAATGAGTCATVGTNDLAASLSLVTPNINVATATTINGAGYTGTGTTTVSSSTSIGRGQYQGTNTNDAATAGNIGEIISSTIAIGSPVSLTTATPANLTSISLTAGDWNVSCHVVYEFVGTTLTVARASISATTATEDVTSGKFSQALIGASINPGGNVTLTIPAIRISVAGTTSEFCVARADFSAGTTAVAGYMQAIRIR